MAPSGGKDHGGIREGGGPESQGQLQAASGPPPIPVFEDAIGLVSRSVLCFNCDEYHSWETPCKERESGI